MYLWIFLSIIWFLNRYFLSLYIPLFLLFWKIISLSGSPQKIQIEGCRFCNLYKFVHNLRKVLQIYGCNLYLPKNLGVQLQPFNNDDPALLWFEFDGLKILKFLKLWNTFRLDGGQSIFAKAIPILSYQKSGTIFSLVTIYAAMPYICEYTVCI